MIYGVGTDIVNCSRFKSWLSDTKKLERFFNSKELLSPENQNSTSKSLEYYASRFAAKEAFVKALGTGFSDFQIKDIFVTKDSLGKPIINLENKAKDFVDNKINSYKIHLSISHEKDNAIAFVVIETL